MLKFLKVIFVFVVSYTFMGFVLLPYSMQSLFTSTVQKFYNVESSVKSVFFNPYTLELSIQDLLLKDKNKNTLVYFHLLNIDFSFKDLLKGKFNFEKILLSHFSINIEKYKNKNFNFSFLTGSRTHSEKSSVKKQNVLNIYVKDITLNHGSLSYSDEEKEIVDLRINNLHCNAHNIEFPSNKKIDIALSFSTPEKGFLDVKSTLTLEPFKSYSHISINDMSLKPYQPFLSENTFLKIKKGTLNGDIKLNYIHSDIFNVKSNLTLTSLLMKDVGENLEMISFKKLALNKINYKDKVLSIQNISLLNPYINVILKKNAKFKKVTLKESNSTKKSIKPFQYFIKNINITDGHVFFEDKKEVKNFKANFSAINTTIENVNFLNQKYSLQFNAIVDKYSTIDINSSLYLNNLYKDTVIFFSCENFNLPSVSAYSEKFAKREINNGKLSTSLQYNINDAKIKAFNKFKLKNLTISSDKNATIPIDFALALLEDKNGIVYIDLPVSGDLRNPDFHILGVIENSFVRLVTNVVTSPFSILASLVSAKPNELSHLDFKFGSSKISPEELEKLDKIIKILEQKHTLALSIELAYNILKDKKVLIKEERISKKNKSDTMQNNLELLALQRAKMIQNYMLIKNIEKQRVLIKDKKFKIFRDGVDVSLKLNLNKLDDFK